MAKKNMKGFKFKPSARVWATITALGTTLLTFAGIHIYSRINSRPQQSKPDSDRPEFNENIGHEVEKEPDITTTPSDTVRPGNNSSSNTTDQNIPVLPVIPVSPIDPITPAPEPGIDESINAGGSHASIIDILAKLTAMAQDSTQRVTNSNTAPNLTVSGLSAMTIDEVNSLIKVDGELYLNGNIKNFTASIINPDKSLDIYHLNSENISTIDFLNAFEEVLDSNQSSLKIQFNQHFKLSNETGIIRNILQHRINDLQYINPTSNEIAYLNNILSNPSKADLSVTLGYCDQASNLYSFTASVNTGNYTYYVPYSFETDMKLDDKALSSTINGILSNSSSSFNVSSLSNTAINKSIHNIMSEVEQSNTFTR